MAADTGSRTQQTIDPKPAPPPRMLPRPLIRTFWVLHRTAHRATGGRFGLAQPTEGARFGLMRLETIGRRSGKQRTAIVGYFEDGPDVVTLAMNGWGEGEPAWWLNLRANPHATATLPGGMRRVRGRAAEGTERERRADAGESDTRMQGANRLRPARPAWASVRFRPSIAPRSRTCAAGPSKGYGVPKRGFDRHRAGRSGARP